jgi:hypothetical protein
MTGLRANGARQRRVAQRIRAGPVDRYAMAGKLAEGSPQRGTIRLVAAQARDHGRVADPGFPQRFDDREDDDRMRRDLNECAGPSAAATAWANRTRPRRFAAQ